MPGVVGTSVAATITGVSPLRVGMFRFTLRAETEVHLPRFKGSALRGAFGAALKRAVCIRDDLNCEGCLVRPSCIYTHLFETLPPAGLNVFHGQRQAPRPFVLEPPLVQKQHYAPGERLRFGLTLIERAVDYLPYVVFAIDEAGRRGLGQERGRFALESVTWRAAKAILRRLWQVASAHCGVELSLDHRRLIERAREVSIVSSHLRWQDWERYSNRQQARMKMGGFVGEMEVTGLDRDFLPVLALGELLHVGTGTTMGLGRFEVTLIHQPRCFEIRRHCAS
ncbi:MAG: CRISPR system precrRNA processing endoribonuclease RAMP protein Cas6 [Acidobacteria bacterium]|nr:CRISPR system precrRNA processing endoribonuclease RAMP protein Cas6 [Acidobacteriota bacterium]